MNANFTTWSNLQTSANGLVATPAGVVSNAPVFNGFSTLLPLALHEATQRESNGKEETLVDAIISDKVRDIMALINMVILAQVISFFGVIANIINIIVFTKQGFGEAMTVTLTGLAVADLGTVTCQSWLSFCWNPLFDFKSLELPFQPLQIVYLSAGQPRLSSVRISAWIIAWATLERCLCITMPFRVREIITPYRSKVFIITLFIINTASSVPFYYTTRIVPYFDEAVNRSYLVLAFTDDRQEIDSISFSISVCLSVCSFVAVAVCTVILVLTLDKASKWRKSAMASNEINGEEKSECVQASIDGNKKQEQNPTSGSTNAFKKSKLAASNKNKRAAKMVSIVSTTFIVCSLPNTLNQLVMALVPEYAKNGRYVNLNQTSWSVGCMAESVNASINIFMYYTMSSKYRSTIQEMLCKRCRISIDGKGSTED
ncbi:chemosensory receptor b [Plakobranchus ocellatus]|uniref:Chemosensory receptor b n=1 Tax=Plakobranchus ocellatus TaxID=259542 RepID=A0AAV3YQT2_9GAST|nr:chemosensory receptor b [Plakobranchus ocellatus]